jgi:rhodanese-related sulfurtransferase
MALRTFGRKFLPVTKILPAIALVCALAGSLPAYQDVTPEQLLTLLATNDSLVLIDVREPFEFDSGHIEGGHLYQLNSALKNSKYAELPVGFPLVFYCGSGFRSAQAVAFMDTVSGGAYNGNIFNLTGGFGNWPYAVVTGGQDGPALIIEPDSLLFDEIIPGTEAERSFSVVNSAQQGAAVVLIPALEAEGFSAPADTAVLLRDDSLRVTVTFHPQELSIYSDSVPIFHGGAGRDTLKVLLSGSGVAMIEGDINSNGRVDIFDLLELLKELSGRENNGARERMDLNGDGALNIIDLLRLLLLIRGDG